MPRYPVFDIHTHPYPPALAARAVGNLEAFYGFRAEGNGTYEDLAAHAAAAGVPEGMLKRLEFARGDQGWQVSLEAFFRAGCPSAE